VGFFQFAAQVGNPVGGNPVQKVRCGFARHQRDDLGAGIENRLIQNFDRVIFGQAHQDCRSDGRRLFVQRFRDIGRAFVRQQDHERGRLGSLIGLERSLSFDVVH
jgi:hypothetical protein